MLEEMKVGELLKIAQLFNKNELTSTFYEVGKSYFIRTVTMHLIGKIKSINQKEILLEKASWIADSGRFHDALKTGELNEVEPFINDVILNRDCIVDASEWNHKLPDVQK